MKRENKIAIATISPVKNRQEIIKKDIVEKIARKEFSKKIPGIQKLAEYYTVNPKTVNKAILALVNEGILYRLGKEGTFVSNSFSSKKTHTISFLSCSTRSIAGYDPYYTEILEGLRCKLEERGYNLVISNIRHVDFRDFNGDGAILEGISQKGEHIETLKKFHIPFLLLDKYSETAQNVSWVSFDYRFGIEKAVKHLIAQGFRRILYIGGTSGYWSSANRIKGYKDGLASAAIPFDKDLIFSRDYTVATGYAGIVETRKKEKEFDSIICGGFHITLGVLRAFEKIPLKIGKDVGLVGFLDPPLAAHISPSLTTIKLPLRKIGAVAATTLLQMIETHSQDIVTHTLKPRLLIRRSSHITEGNQ